MKANAETPASWVCLILIAAAIGYGLGLAF